MPPEAKEEKGFILVMAIIALAVMVVILPALVMLITNETKWTLKQKRTTVAFHMAEQGLDRGVWKLQESDQVWDNASTGTVIPGYNFDVIYASTDTSSQSEGEYLIQFSTITSAGAVRVRAVGRDASTKEERALEAVYTKTAMNAGLQSRGALAYKSGLNVHWGPVINYGNITETPDQYYPRKITKGSIKEGGGGTYDEDPNPPNGHDFYSSWPEPATYDYNTFQTKLGNPPSINLEGFKALAKATSMPALKKQSGSSGAAAGNIPAGSGYYDGTDNVDLSKADGTPLLFYCSTCVLFIDNVNGGGDFDIKDNNSQVRLRAIIVKGTFDMNANNTPPYSSRIPVGAALEYAHPSAAADWAAFSGTGEGNVYNIPDEIQLHAYVYVGGNVSNSGGGDPAMVGALDIVGEMSSNNTIVYYDSTVSTSVLAVNVKPQLQYWREIRPNEALGE